MWQTRAATLSRSAAGYKNSTECRLHFYLLVEWYSTWLTFNLGLRAVGIEFNLSGKTNAS